MPVSTSIQNPYYFGGPVEGPRFFEKGRGEELRRIFSRLRSGMSISLVGERRIGSTSLLLKIRDVIQREEALWPDGFPVDSAILCVYLDAQGLHSAEKFYGKIIRKVQEQAPDLTLPSDNDQSHFASLLESLSRRGKRPVLLLDEFGSILKRETFAGEWEGLRSEINAGKVILVTATPKSINDYFRPGGEGSPFFNVFTNERIGAFDQESLDDFLTKTAEPSGFPVDDCRGQVRDLGGRWPFFTQMACYFYWDAWTKTEHLSVEDHAVVWDQFADQAKPHFEYFWRHLAPEEQDILAYLAKLPTEQQTRVLNVLAVLLPGMQINLSHHPNPGVEELRTTLASADYASSEQQDRALAAWADFSRETRRQLLSFTQPHNTVRGLGLKGYILDWKHLFSSAFARFILLLDREEHLVAIPLSPVPKMDRDVDAQREHETAAFIIQGKRAPGEFDVFLCYNSEDKTAVKEIAEHLKQQGILPWLDEWELRPGLPWQRPLEEQIEQINCAAVFVGKKGIGPWQQMEVEAFLREFVSRGCPVMPVLLPDAPRKPRLPVFLKGMTWVDFREEDPDPMEQLIWGITGKRSPTP